MSMRFDVLKRLALDKRKRVMRLHTMVNPKNGKSRLDVPLGCASSAAKEV